MELISASVNQVLEVAGDLWLLALVGSFFGMVCESAKPKPQEGESRAAPQGFALLIMLMSLATPLLLLVHAFMSGGALIGIVVLLAALMVGSAIIGALLGGLAPDVGRTLNKAAPVLAVPVFALAIYVSWASVASFATHIAALVAR